MRCLRCLYLLIRGGCPICGGRRIKGVPPFTVLTRERVENPRLPVYWSPAPVILTPELRAIPVKWEMFLTTQHHRAWVSGNPLRTHRKRYKVDPVTRDMVKRECGYKCSRCRKPDYLTIEHIIPVGLGGSNHQSNLTLFCQACQRWSWARFREVLKAVDAEAAA